MLFLHSICLTSTRTPVQIPTNSHHQSFVGLAQLVVVAPALVSLGRRLLELRLRLHQTVLEPLHERSRRALGSALRRGLLALAAPGGCRLFGRPFGDGGRGFGSVGLRGRGGLRGRRGLRDACARCWSGLHKFVLGSVSALLFLCICWWRGLSMSS